MSIAEAEELVELVPESRQPKKPPIANVPGRLGTLITNRIPLPAPGYRWPGQPIRPS